MSRLLLTGAFVLGLAASFGIAFAFNAPGWLLVGVVAAPYCVGLFLLLAVAGNILWRRYALR